MVSAKAIESDRGIPIVEVAQIEMTEGNYDDYNAH